MHDDSEKSEPAAAAPSAPMRRGLLSSPRKSVLAAMLGAGALVALVVAGNFYWQRGIAVEQPAVAPRGAVRAVPAIGTEVTAKNPAASELAAKVAADLQRSGDELKSQGDLD